MLNNLRFVYFGGEPLGVPVLHELKKTGLVPSLIVCNLNRPAGRGNKLTPPPVKQWAEEHNIDVWQPTDLKDQSAATVKLSKYDLFVVVAYNHILPQWLLDLPTHKTLNLHPSLLPKYRGCNPIREAILADDKDTIGVTVMQLDAKMDHGPIVAQMPMEIVPENWPMPGRELDLALAHMGGALLAATIPLWVAGKITPLEQDHDQATFTKKMTKADGDLSIDPHNLPVGDEAYQTLLKIRAYDGFPGTFFMHEDKRIKITKAELAPSGELRIISIIPEGKKETTFEIYFN